MITATLQEAKAKLNQLVEAALRGEQVVLMRGPHIVATIKPLSPDDVELKPRLSDGQAERFWSELGEEEVQSFEDSAAAIRFLKKSC